MPYISLVYRIKFFVLSGVCLVLYFNETLCSVSPNLSLTRRTTYEDDARIRSILRLVDRFGLKELQEISEQYADRGRNISTQLNASQISNNFTVEKIEKEFDICSLGRFDVDEFLENHKKQCLIESAKEKIARKELLGISATQAVIQYQGTFIISCCGYIEITLPGLGFSLLSNRFFPEPGTHCFGHFD